CLPSGTPGLRPPEMRRSARIAAPDTLGEGLGKKRLACERQKECPREHLRSRLAGPTNVVCKNRWLRPSRVRCKILGAHELGRLPGAYACNQLIIGQILHAYVVT